MSYKHIRSLERGVTVLQFLNQQGAATAGDIARHISLPRPTVYRILDTLEDCGLVYRSPSQQKVYRLTEAVGLLGENLAHAEPISAAARTVLHDPNETTPWPVFLSTLTDDGIIIRETTRGNSVFWTELGWIGSVAPVWDVAAGRVIAAFSDPDRQASLLAQGPQNGADILQKIVMQGYEEERNAQGKITGLSVPVGSGAALQGALVIIWDTDMDSGSSMVENFLGRLIALSNRIMNELGAGAE